MRYEGVTCDLCGGGIPLNTSAGWLMVPVLVGNGHDRVIVDVCPGCLQRPIAALAEHVFRRSYEQNGKPVPVPRG